MAPKVDRTYILVDVSPRMHTRLPLVEQALFGLAMSKVCQVSGPVYMHACQCAHTNWCARRVSIARTLTVFIDANKLSARRRLADDQ